MGAARETFMSQGERLVDLQMDLFTYKLEMCATQEFIKLGLRLPAHFHLYDFLLNLPRLAINILSTTLRPLHTDSVCLHSRREGTHENILLQNRISIPTIRETQHIHLLTHSFVAVLFGRAEHAAFHPRVRKI